jgi:hypothetical protein
MLKNMGRTLLAAAIAGNLGAAAGAAIAPMTLQDYLALSGPAPSRHVAYGAAPSQYAELFLPAGDGPFPVAVLMHGGCWTKEFGGITQMRNMAGDLAARGIAAWNVEYRRVDEEGGGYPGMYLDMNAALDLLRARRRAIRSTSRAMVRSATRPAASWCNGWRARRGIPRAARCMSPIRCRCATSSAWAAWPTCAAKRPDQVQLRPRAPCSWPAPPARPAGCLCRHLAGRPAAQRRRTVLSTANWTRSRRYAWPRLRARAQAAGDAAEVVILPGASHYDEVAATSPSWRIVSAQIRQALGL